MKKLTEVLSIVKTKGFCSFFDHTHLDPDQIDIAGDLALELKNVTALNTLQKKVTKTKGGDSVILYAVRWTQVFAIHGAIMDEKGYHHLTAWKMDGSISGGLGPCPDDLNMEWGKI